MRFVRLLPTLAVSSLLAGCTLLTPLPDRVAPAQRIGAMPTANLPIERPVTIYWSENQIPFIVAETDEDLALSLGLVHAHLRLAQMEILRRISQGRISEMAGPFTVDIDHALRILNYGRGVDRVIAEMPPETKAFLDAFVRGVNHYQANLKDEPHEFKVLGIRREAWTVRDVLTIGRLAGTDVNWLVAFRLLQLSKRPDWQAIWTRILKTGGDSVASFTNDKKAGVLGDLIGGSSKSGSNSFAVSAARSQTGGALLANDPHLGLNLPNLWMIVGIKSPSYHAVGLTIPGVPIIGVGRNPSIGWGGTNMRAVSSDFYDISKLSKDKITTRTETIKVRWWRDRKVTIRETPLGPVLSDASVLKWTGKPFALRWIGHERGDEVTAMLRAMRATDWRQFKAAFKTFAVSGQNMVYADSEGNIGQLTATILPIRPNETPPHFVLDATDPKWQWQGVLDVDVLPSTYNPARGYVASANNRPARFHVPIGYLFSADDRIERLHALLSGDRKLGLVDIRLIQQDVYQSSSVEVRDAVVARIERMNVLEGMSPAARKLVERMAAWDGHYRKDSRGAVAFELFFSHFVRAFYVRKYGPEDGEAFLGFGRIKRMLVEDMTSAPEEGLRADLRSALAAAAQKAGRFESWGEMHRLGLAHPLAFAPVIGDKYRFGDYPVAGSTDTLMKTAHNPSDGRHFTRYGQNARHISDMSDPDENYFVLVGGQDGWLSSPSAFDQARLWLAGKYVRVPLRIETVSETFETRQHLTPRTGD